MDIIMRKFVFLLLLVTCWNPSWTLQNNLTMPEVPIELSITSEDDSERELSSQLEEADSRAGGWSSWSEWSACSRSCDGGASHQLRTCKTGPCRGEHVRYQICNMQVIACFAFLITANASTIAPNTKIIEGPNSKTTLTGPDGSVITSSTAGGQIIIEERLEEASQGRSVVAAAPQATAITSDPTTPTEVASAPAILAKTTTIDGSPSETTQFSYFVPIVSAHAPPLVAVQAAPIVTPNVVSLLPNVVIPQNLDAIITEPAGTVATSKAIPEPVAVPVPVVYA